MSGVTDSRLYLKAVSDFKRSPFPVAIPTGDRHILDSCTKLGTLLLWTR